MRDRCCQAEVALLVVHRQDAHLVLCCYEAPHLLGEVANPLLLMLEYQPQPLTQLMVAGYNAVVAHSSQGKDDVEHGDGGLPDKALTRGISRL